jgi:hypothetical protein
MKRFIVSALCTAVFFLGLGVIVDKVGARFRSDEKALALIRAARTAIGGDNAIAGVQSLRIKGSTTHVFKVDGMERVEPGETEIAIQLPDKLSKSVKIGHDVGEGVRDQLVEKRIDTVIVRKDKDGNEIIAGSGKGKGTGIGIESGQRRVVVLEKPDGTLEEIRRDENENIIKELIDRKIMSGEGNVKLRSEQVQKIEAEHKTMQQNELFRLTLSLLLSAPAGVEPNYNYGGEATVDSTPCNLVVAEIAGASVKLYLDRSTNLPYMVAYTGEHMPMIVRFENKVPASESGTRDTVFFKRIDGPEATAEFQVRFSDYRSVSGIQLPFRWLTTAGDMREEFNVGTYEVNPADIGKSFENREQRVMLKTRKEG